MLDQVPSLYTLLWTVDSRSTRWLASTTSSLRTTTRVFLQSCFPDSQFISTVEGIAGIYSSKWLSDLINRNRYKPFSTTALFYRWFIARPCHVINYGCGLTCCWQAHSRGATLSKITHEIPDLIDSLYKFLDSF